MRWKGMIIAAWEKVFSKKIKGLIKLKGLTGKAGDFLQFFTWRTKMNNEITQLVHTSIVYVSSVQQTYVFSKDYYEYVSESLPCTGLCSFTVEKKEK